MRELRSCDFCGEQAAGTFELVPPELEPTEAEQRRVVLCTDCKTLLSELVEPLLAYAGVDTGDADTSRGSTADAGTDAPDDTTDAGETTTQDRAGTPPTARDDGDRPESVTDDGDGVDATAETSRESDDLEGVAMATERDDAATETDASASSSSEPEADSAEEPARPPRAYGKVLRLLRNREFPIKRSEAESLAAGAYDLDDDEVEAVLEHAIDRGEFVDGGRKLRRP